MNGASYAQPVFVSAEVTQRLLIWREVIERLRRVYSVPHGPKVSPPRTVARGDSSQWVRSLTAVPPGSKFMGAKVFGFGRQKKVTYLIALFDQSTGNLTALVDGSLVTSFRTAATSAVAVDRLATNKSLKLGVLGSGLEARSHIEAISNVRQISEMKVFSPTEAKRESFAKNSADILGCSCKATSTPEDAVADADLVVAAARSYAEKPILLGRWLKRGAMVVSIGSTLPEQREIDEAVVSASDLIICDAVEEVLHETGDMLAAKVAGIPLLEKVASLNELMSGAIDMRAAASRQPMYKSVGAAIQDIVVAELAFDRAVETGSAQVLAAPFLIKG